MTITIRRARDVRVVRCPLVHHAALVAALVALAPPAASAEEAPTTATTVAAVEPAAAPTVTATAPPLAPVVPLAATPPPYSLPWQLRPVVPGSVVRSDTALAAYHTDAGDGTTVASTFLMAYKVRPTLAPLVRFGVVRDAAPGGAEAAAFTNPLLGVTWGKPLAKPFKLALFAAFTLPVGSGGGNAPNLERLAANKAAVAARSSMDNAMFAVNDHALIGGADLAWVRGGLTVQAEVTLFQLSRIRGLDVQPDAHKTNLTSGVHLGWFARPWLSLGSELRYQRWLSTPKAVAADATGATRDNLTAAVGVRGHLKLSGKRWLRPGLAYVRPLDDPMQGKGYDIVQVDVPFAF